MLTSLSGFGILGTTNFQSFSTDASSLGTTLFFAGLFALIVTLIFALASGFLGQSKILATVEALVVGVVATVSIAGVTTFITAQGATGNAMITGTWGTVAALTPAASAGLSPDTLNVWLNS